MIRKDLVTNNATSCPAFSSSIFLLPIQLTGTVGGNLSMGHVHPAVHYTLPSSFATTTNPVYMVSTVVPPSSTYKVWRVKNAATGNPTVSVLSLSAGNVYEMPTGARQPTGGVAVLDINDARIMQVTAVGDTLWATHQTVCDQPDEVSPFNKPCVRAMRFSVGETNNSMTAAIQHDVTFASPEFSADLAYYMPGIAVNSSQQTAISFLASSPIMYQSAAWTLKYSLDQVYAAATVFAAGSCARSKPKVGDYVGAHTNPNDLVSFWLAGEAAALSGQGCNWRTQVIQVTP